MPMSVKQLRTMEMIAELNKFHGETNRWFVQAELPDVTKHTLDALVNNRGMLETEVRTVNSKDIVYYRKLVI